MSTQAVSSFSVKTDVFEGPLELLIELVEQRKLLINDISLAAVTDEYMARVSVMQERSLPHTAQFISLAATLLLIKSKSLLPVLTLTQEETASIEDLEARLRRYQIIRAAATHLSEQFGASPLYLAESTPVRQRVYVPDNYCTIPELVLAMERVIRELPQSTKPASAVVRSVVSLEEMIVRLQRRIEAQLTLSFKEMHQDEPERKVVIVGFLAILELFKRGNLLITQPKHFADITIELQKSHTPRYY